MKTFETDFSGISLDMSEIYLAMGYRDTEPDENIKTLIDEKIKSVSPLCRPRFGYEILPVERVAEKSVHVLQEHSGKPVEITTGSVITPFFRDAERIALFVATAGEGFDQWFTEIKRSGDILNEYIAHAIGSEIAEATARAMAAELETDASGKGLKISNSYSPGYCGWHVRDQQALFSLLPPCPCGVTLTPSSLMLPIKSVSGIIGLGRKIKKMLYGCELCGKTDCYKKRTGA